MTLRIGVTGHRRYRASSATDAALDSVLSRLVAGDSSIVVVSSLAEGADRVVCHRLLPLPGATLEVVLPLDAADFADDFESAESRAEFAQLLAAATRVDVVATGDSRDEAYERAGHGVVARCDVLVAMWDGSPSRGRGGTADIVRYALEHDVMVEVVLVERDP